MNETIRGTDCTKLWETPIEQDYKRHWLYEPMRDTEWMRLWEALIARNYENHPLNKIIRGTDCTSIWETLINETITDTDCTRLTEALIERDYEGQWLDETIWGTDWTRLQEGLTVRDYKWHWLYETMRNTDSIGRSNYHTMATITTFRMWMLKPQQKCKQQLKVFYWSVLLKCFIEVFYWSVLFILSILDFNSKLKWKDHRLANRKHLQLQWKTYRLLLLIFCLMAFESSLWSLSLLVNNMVQNVQEKMGVCSKQISIEIITDHV